MAELQAGALILVDKPLHWTSFDVVNKIRSYTHAKMGHAGTLDPLATGLLVCCTGKMTKQITNYQKQEKEYIGIIQLGASTPTFDLESSPENQQDISGLTQEMVDRVKQQFIGAIEQLPPIHSAIKQGGQPIYKLAREGKPVVVLPRAVIISELDAELHQGGALHFRVSCSTGTYIRSLANDIGAALGVGGHLSALRRTKIGLFDVAEAPTMDEWIGYLDSLPAEPKPKKLRPKPRPKAL